MKYKVLYFDNSQLRIAIHDLEKEIQKALMLGWELQGGVNVIYNSNSGVYFVSQALIKKCDVL